ncbi:MAG: dephospho-CoA kinase [Candidatus Ratteibacteria bacterium]|nr:dephospho-CoA kinase [Candidatus Ratteibacteria bacterium]
MGNRNIKQNKILRVGITGIFGSGKTTVSSMFKKAGICVVSCDDIVHRLLKKKIIIKKIKDSFGEDVVNHGEINRRALGDKIFSNRTQRRKLEQIVHPEVFKEINRILDSKKRGGIIVIEIPLLFETKSERLVDKIVVVKASRQIIIERLKDRFSKEEILKRWKAQIPLKEKEKKADYVINNSGDYSETFQQVKNLIKNLKSIVK